MSWTRGSVAERFLQPPRSSHRVESWKLSRAGVGQARITKREKRMRCRCVREREYCWWVLDPDNINITWIRVRRELWGCGK